MGTEKEKTGLVGPVIFCAAALGAVYLVFSIPSGPEKCGSDAGAYVMSQAPVLDALKAPSTAKFPSISEPGVSVTSDGKCLYTVRSYVDAKNGFGATARQSYTAKLAAEDSGNGWSVISVDME